MQAYGLDQPIVGESKEVNESVQGPKDEDGDVQVFPMQTNQLTCYLEGQMHRKGYLEARTGTHLKQRYRVKRQETVLPLRISILAILIPWIFVLLRSARTMTRDTGRLAAACEVCVTRGRGPCLYRLCQVSITWEDCDGADDS